MNLRLAALLLVIASWWGGSTAAADGSGWRVSLRGVGPVRIGMTLAEASRRLGGDLRASDACLAGGCCFLTSRRLPAGVALRLRGGVVDRIDVDSGDTATLSGARVGSTADEVRRIYGERVRDVSLPRAGFVGHYLVFTPEDEEDAELRLVFEVSGGRVTSFRVGLVTAVEDVEGCD